jgi:interferon gamma-inducible protein 30
MHNLNSIVFLILLIYTLNAKLKSNKITIKIFYDTLCPDSVRLFQNNMGKLIKSDLYKMIDLSLIPGALQQYIRETHTFDCLHGQAECTANKLHACALLLLEDREAVDYISCFMNEIYNYQKDIEATTQRCAGKNFNNLYLCARSTSADEYVLELLNKKTEVSRQFMNISPWVVINSKYYQNELVEEDLIRYICTQLNNTENIKECNL